jgi:hypothetical protein
LHDEAPCATGPEPGSAGRADEAAAIGDHDMMRAEQPGQR